VRGASQDFERARERSRAEGSKPFDIAEYTTAAAEIATMARDANALVSDSHSLLASPAWTKRQEDVSRLANEILGRAELGSRRTVNHLAWRMMLVLFVFFVFLALYRVIVRQIEGRRVVRPAKNASAGEITGLTPETFVIPRVRSPETKEHRPSPLGRQL